MSPFAKAKSVVVNAFEACGGACPGASSKGLRKAGRQIQLKYPAYLMNLDACEVAFCCDDVDDTEDPPLFGHGRFLEEEECNPPTAALEKLVVDLFRLQDLNNDGLLDEQELIKLNEKISQLHYGKDIDRAAVKDKFTELFRAELDQDGNPVNSKTFRTYMLKVLDGLDRNRQAQEMIIEQFIAEAKSGRAAFRCTSLQSTADNPFLPPVISIDSIANLDAMRSTA